MKKIYYYLPIDGYGQPDGNVNEVQLTKVEYEARKAQGQYIYDSYSQALYRAQD